MERMSWMQVERVVANALGREEVNIDRPIGEYGAESGDVLTILDGLGVPYMDYIAGGTLNIVGRARMRTIGALQKQARRPWVARVFYDLANSRKPDNWGELNVLGFMRIQNYEADSPSEASMRRAG